MDSASLLDVQGSQLIVSQLEIIHPNSLHSFPFVSKSRFLLFSLAFFPDMLKICALIVHLTYITLEQKMKHTHKQTNTIYLGHCTWYSAISMFARLVFVKNLSILQIQINKNLSKTWSTYIV